MGVRGVVVMAMVLIVVLAVGLIVVMPVLVFVAMPVAVGVLVVSQGNRHAVGLAGAGAFALAQVTAVGQAFDVVVMAVLGGAHLALKTQHLGPVLAQ